MSSTDRPASPTAEERERKDAEDRKREKEEQAALPYKWTQTLTEADVVIPIAGNYKARDLVVEIKKNSLKVGIKGQEPLLEVSRFPYTLERLHPPLPSTSLPS